MSENQEPIVNEEVTEEEDEVTEDVIVDSRLQKSVNRLKKVTKIKEKALEGLSLEEQFDRLEFMVENAPKKLKKTKNKPIIGLPTDLEEVILGTSVNQKEGGEGVFFKTSEWLNLTKKK